VVLPVETNIRLLITATDVLHSWAMPSFGVKMDAVPGRINETWFRIDEPGTYYGQCSELCGDYHAFMPIMIRAVAKDEFETWTAQAQEEFAQAGAVDVARR
ncbi:MAG: coxB, partial [Geminicoccaceae bacterium]|nr:coxB [Geminicoccaceae bacterium]